MSVNVNPWSGLLRLLAGLGCGLLLSGPAAAQTPAQAQATQAQGQVQAVGVTQAIKETRLSMTVGGRVEGLLVKEGQRVRVGQVLLHLDRTAEELEVRRRRLLRNDSSRLAELREKEKTLSEQVESLRSLLESGGVSRKQLEDEEMALGTVQAERIAQEVGKQREQVELDQAIEAYERRHLRAPIAGVVTKIVPRLGESLSANDPVVHVVDVRRVRFLGTLPAQQGSRIKVGQTVTLRLGAEADLVTRRARVVYLSPVADTASGLVEFIAEFDNLDGAVRPGLTGRAQF